MIGGRRQEDSEARWELESADPDGSVSSAPAMELSGADLGGACISFQLEE